MTMDNGEGLPLDEAEAGQEDPQDWYFDLPGGAWERQEEKNRNLRQRVLGNLEEDAEKQKSDPFGKKFELKPEEPEATYELKRPDPQQKKRGGLFGFGKKKDGPAAEQQPWEARRDRLDVPDGEVASDSDDWSTEPSLKLSPFPRTESDATVEQAKWGESDGGWHLSRQAEEPERPKRHIVPEAQAFEAQEAEPEEGT